MARVATNAAVFAIGFALLALSPVTIHSPIRLVKLVILLVGLVVMLLGASIQPDARRLETERRESSARALAAQEAERLRIARELHDETGQTLTAVALRAEHAVGKSARSAGPSTNWPR